MTLAFSVLAPYQVSLPPPPQCQTRNQTRIRSDIQTVSPVNLITTRRSLLRHSSTILLYFFTGGDASAASTVKFFEIAGSGGVKALELRAGSGGTPRDGDEVITYQNALYFSLFMFWFYFRSSFVMNRAVHDSKFSYTAPNYRAWKETDEEENWWKQ